MPAITIKMNYDNSLLLQAGEDQVQLLEGNYYVAPSLIDPAKFEVSERIYICPVKGKCLWVDLKTEQGWINDICWVYPQPKPAYKHIAGWYGFYPSNKHYEITEAL